MVAKKEVVENPREEYKQFIAIENHETVLYENDDIEALREEVNECDYVDDITIIDTHNGGEYSCKKQVIFQKREGLLQPRTCTRLEG